MLPDTLDVVCHILYFYYYNFNWVCMILLFMNMILFSIYYYYYIRELTYILKFNMGTKEIKYFFIQFL